jgi:uncharacterized protein YecE (DUF72 family)
MGMKETPTYLGTAGWSLPRTDQPLFAAEGSHLVRYAGLLNAAEINSSFHRSHRPSTYARWAAAVPPSFRFSVKIPKTITHGKALVGATPELDAFFEEIAPLGDKATCLLVQLPPKLALDKRSANAFFSALRRRFERHVAAEPRHASWFTPEGDALFARHQVGRVAADPPRVTAAAVPGGWPALVYYRLHGSPRTYYSSYDVKYLTRLASHIAAARQSAEAVWCIFDNTTSGAAMGNTLTLRRLLADAAIAPTL